MTTSESTPRHEKCRNILIHEAHEWGSYEPASDDPDENGYVPIDLWCEGNADQDVPMDRFECCEHCASTAVCALGEGHGSPCKDPDCKAGNTMLGQVSA